MREDGKIVETLINTKEVPELVRIGDCQKCYVDAASNMAQSVSRVVHGTQIWDYCMNRSMDTSPQDVRQNADTVEGASNGLWSFCEDGLGYGGATLAQEMLYFNSYSNPEQCSS